jgi:hypothetical protein
VANGAKMDFFFLQVTSEFLKNERGSDSDVHFSIEFYEFFNGFLKVNPFEKTWF